jgi:hypothetical protein
LQQQTPGIRVDPGSQGYRISIVFVLDGNNKTVIAFFAVDQQEPGRIDHDVVLRGKSSHAKDEETENGDANFHDFENLSIIIVVEG